MFECHFHCAVALHNLQSYQKALRHYQRAIEVVSWRKVCAICLYDCKLRSRCSFSKHTRDQTASKCEKVRSRQGVWQNRLPTAYPFSSILLTPSPLLLIVCTPGACPFTRSFSFSSRLENRDNTSATQSDTSRSFYYVPLIKWPYCINK